MDHRAPPPQQPELQPPLPVAPVRRRRSQRISSGQAAIPVVVPRPAAPRRRQIPAAPPAAAAPWDADARGLMLLAHIAVAQADAEAEASSRPAPAPAPAPAGKKGLLRRYCRRLASAAAADEEKEEPYVAPPVPLLAAVDHQNPSSSLSMGHGDAATDEKKEEPYVAPPLPPPLAVDHQNSSSSLSMGHGDAAIKVAAGDCKEAAACPQPQGNAGSSEGDRSGGAVASSDAGASPMQMQLADDDEEELEQGEIPPEKPAAGYNADPAAHGSLLASKEVEMAAVDEEDAKTIAGEPAATGSNAHRATPMMVVRREEGGRAPTEMSADEEEKRKREVYIGGLSQHATEDHVRAALSAAGEITHVRMFLNRMTGKNRGYCFVAYRDASMASKAVAELGNVKICGKPCRLAVPEGNETPKQIAQRDPTAEDYNRIYEPIRQPSPTLAAHQSSYTTSWGHHASYVVPPVVGGYYYPMYHNGNIAHLPPPDLNYRGLLGSGPSGRSQIGQSGSSSRPAGQPHRNRN